MGIPESLKKFLPVSEDVLVDETVLSLRPATIAQQAELLDAMAGLDWAPVLRQLAPAFERLVALKDGPGPVTERIQAALPDLTRDAIHAIGVLVGTALAPAVAALLDNERNYRAVWPVGTVQPAAEYEGTTYLRSPDLRRWIARNVTTAQAVHVLARATEMNGWRDLAGKALRALTAAKPMGPVNGTPVATALNG